MKLSLISVLLLVAFHPTLQSGYGLGKGGGYGGKGGYGGLMSGGYGGMGFGEIMTVP